MRWMRHRKYRFSESYIPILIVIISTWKITGPSYLLWAIENYAEMCKIADQIASKEAVEEEEEENDMDDGQKMDEIIRYIR